jgi:hypothetical protein
MCQFPEKQRHKSFGAAIKARQCAQAGEGEHASRPTTEAAMSVCAFRPETPGFWTPCKSCPCGAEVRAEIEAAKMMETT